MMRVNNKIKNLSGNTVRANKGFKINWKDQDKLLVYYEKSSKTYEMD